MDSVQMYDERVPAHILIEVRSSRAHSFSERAERRRKKVFPM